MIPFGCRQRPIAGGVVGFLLLWVSLIYVFNVKCSSLPFPFIAPAPGMKG